MTKIYLTHTPDALAHYYGERALAQLRTLGEVTLNPRERPLTLDEFAGDAAGHEIVVASREAAAPARLTPWTRWLMPTDWVDYRSSVVCRVSCA